MASEIGDKILKYLADHGNSVDTQKLAELWNEEHQKIVGAVKSLQSLGDVIEAELTSTAQWALTDEGRAVVEGGSHEALVFNAVPTEGGISQADIMAQVPNAKIGFSKAMSLGWIAVDKSGSGGPKVVRKVQSIEDAVQQHLKALLVDQNSMTNPLKQEYKKRKLVQEVVVKSYVLKPGPSFSTSVSKQETELTPEMIASGSWKTRQFKPYNLEALGTPVTRGHLHPLMKVRTEFRQIFLEMGFTEMPTNNFVESSFWNFDALFQPQQHPARDAHDTFFISDPAMSTEFPKDYVERVKTVHSVGGYGSTGYGYDWKIEEAQKNLLRTHTTAVSARMLYKLSQNGFKPAKYFSIDRVFRNETLDATHLAEFHQIEGVIADYGLTLGHLIGTLYEFFRKLGIDKLRFKPAYNPYTEPSMEVFSYHPGLAKWVEVGNSGVFRPEMLLPMGLPEGVSVIAWGLSLERPTMIKYGVDNIRDLVGPKVNLQMVADNPLCRLDKHRPGTAKGNDLDDLKALECQMESIMRKLEDAQKQVLSLKRKSNRNQEENLTIVIEADPAHPPSAIRALLGQITVGIKTSVTVHSHSSLPDSSVRQGWLKPVESSVNRPDNQLNLTWIWKAVGPQPILKFVNRPDRADLRGEASIARLLARLTESWTNCSVYEAFGTTLAAQIDELIDLTERSTDIAAISRRLEQRLGRSDWLVGEGRGIKSLADIFIAAVLENHAIQNRQLKEWALRSS